MTNKTNDKIANVDDLTILRFQKIFLSLCLFFLFILNLFFTWFCFFFVAGGLIQNFKFLKIFRILIAVPYMHTCVSCMCACVLLCVCVCVRWRKKLETAKLRDTNRKNLVNETNWKARARIINDSYILSEHI